MKFDRRDVLQSMLLVGAMGKAFTGSSATAAEPTVLRNKLRQDFSRSAASVSPARGGCRLCDDCTQPGAPRGRYWPLPARHCLWTGSRPRARYLSSGTGRRGSAHVSPLRSFLVSHRPAARRESLDAHAARLDDRRRGDRAGDGRMGLGRLVAQNATSVLRSVIERPHGACDIER